MAKECTLRYYDVFNDRGSVSRCLSQTVETDAKDIVPGKDLPGWTFGGIVPKVDYYDGEVIAVSVGGKIFRCRAKDEEVEIFSAVRPENIHVQESVSVCLGLGALSYRVPFGDFGEMYRHGSYNVLTAKALPLLGNDSTATMWFLRVFSTYECMFMLDSNILDVLRKHARVGNRYALFAIGRYNICVRPMYDSDRKAEEYFASAYSEGLPEAAAALSRMYAMGETGLVDRLKAKELLMEAMEKECDFAAQIHLTNMIFGRYGYRAEPEKAKEILDSLIERDERRQVEANPQWYHMRGMALRQFKSLSAARKDFETAASLGLVTAWSDCALACGYNDMDELVDREACMKVLETGIWYRDDFSFYMKAVLEAEEYDGLSEWKKCYAREKLKDTLEKSYRLGSSAAAELLGDIYYNGWYDMPEDNGLAWQWYARGSILVSFSCYEKMFDMVLNHYVEEDTTFRDDLAIRGARYGSERLLNETVIAYSQGRLTAYAAEIEQYYVPVFDAGDRDGDEEEYPDDDGRFDAYV